MQMHEQAERDVAAERAAAEGTEARARAQAMVKAATQAHQRVIDVALAEQAALRQTHDEIEADEEELAAHLYPATSVDEKRQMEHKARMARLPGGLPPAHPAFDEAVDYFGGEMPALEAIDLEAPFFQVALDTVLPVFVRQPAVLIVFVDAPALRQLAPLIVVLGVGVPRKSTGTLALACVVST
jgi:hypothetical protein